MEQAERHPWLHLISIKCHRWHGTLHPNLRYHPISKVLDVAIAPGQEASSTNSQQAIGPEPTLHRSSSGQVSRVTEFLTATLSITILPEQVEAILMIQTTTAGTAEVAIRKTATTTTTLPEVHAETLMNQDLGATGIPGDQMATEMTLQVIHPITEHRVLGAVHRTMTMSTTIPETTVVMVTAGQIVSETTTDKAMADHPVTQIKEEVFRIPDSSTVPLNKETTSVRVSTSNRAIS